jgi:hypothetical protein
MTFALYNGINGCYMETPCLVGKNEASHPVDGLRLRQEAILRPPRRIRQKDANVPVLVPSLSLWYVVYIRQLVLNGLNVGQIGMLQECTELSQLFEEEPAHCTIPWIFLVTMDLFPVRQESVALDLYDSRFIYIYIALTYKTKGSRSDRKPSL